MHYGALDAYVQLMILENLSKRTAGFDPKAAEVIEQISIENVITE